MRRLQEYERYKKAAEDIDSLERLERDVFLASGEVVERKVVKALPEVKVDALIKAFKDVMTRAEMYSHHHIQRELLSVRQRMSDLLADLQAGNFSDFTALFDPTEGRMGVVVTFLAILELMKESLIEIVQAEPFAPLHVKAATQSTHDAQLSENASLTEVPTN